ncbi:hypothetical protein GDO86_015385 [Hymenochirus boettgeri]|uniref:Uncharacterized protein n=1 Tax=Hymenochirus boettgeri TaxID=247094 RepID=A0A8T2JSQ0_9PIPI|nr:hypothetical protein GDO86_015385 [Hymenochirus boettgeri]
MAAIAVYDNSEAVELSNTHRLFLKPKSKLIITVIIPDDKDPCRPIPNWEVLEQLKSLVTPDHFSSLKVLRSTKEYIRIEGEADTKILALDFILKLHGNILQIDSIKDPLSIHATETPLELLTDQELLILMAKAEGDSLDDAENNTVSTAIHCEGLPCKWFSMCGSNAEKPSEDVLRIAFEKYGKLSCLDIPMLDPYREESVSNSNLSSGVLQTFDAFLQYEDKLSSINAMQSIRGMKLMYLTEDGKCLACDIKVSLDTTKYFSEEAVNKRNDERLKLQELEQQRKQEKEEEIERKRKAAERKYRARKRRARLKRKLQKQKECAEILDEKEVRFEGEENTEEWTERKLLLAHRRVESINLLTLLLGQVKGLVEVNKLNKESTECEFFEDSCDSTISPYSSVSKSLSPKALRDKEKESSHHETESEENFREEPHSYFPLMPTMKQRVREKRQILLHQTYQNLKREPGDSQEQVKDEPETIKGKIFECDLSKNSCAHDISRGECYKKLKIYETEEFINYLLNYYDYPQYARLILGTKDNENKTWYPRVVYCTGDTFQIKLKNKNSHFLEMKHIQQPTIEMDSDDIEKKIPDTLTTNHPPEMSCTKIILKEDLLVKSDPKAPLDRTTTHPKDNKRVQKNPWNNEDSISSESDNELKDVLEKISSTSEYFSEDLSESETKRNIRKKSRKQRKITCLKKAKSCSFCESNKICHHQDILGHLLHSYTICRNLKKHSKCHLTPKCNKTIVPQHYDGETSESETDEQDCVVRNRKKLKKNPTSSAVIGRNHSKENCINTQRVTSLRDPFQETSYGEWVDRQDEMSDATCCYGEHHRSTKKIPTSRKYCIPEYQEEHLKQEEDSWDSDKTSSWSSSSSHNISEATVEPDTCPKSSFSDCLDWEHHFYCGEELVNGIRYKC